MNIPNQYMEYLEKCTSFEGETDYNICSIFILEKASDIERLNLDLQTGKFIPGYTAFATDGGNELYAFDKNGNIWLIPMIALSIVDATFVAHSWDEFILHIINTAQQGDAPEPASPAR